MAPPLQTPCINQKQIKREEFFLNYYVLRTKELVKPGQIQSKDFWDEKLIKLRQI